MTNVRVKPDMLVRVRKLEAEALDLADKARKFRDELAAGRFLQYLNPDGTWVDFPDPKKAGDEK